MSRLLRAYAAQKQAHDGNRHIGERRAQVWLGKHHEHGNTTRWRPAFMKIRPRQARFCDEDRRSTWPPPESGSV